MDKKEAIKIISDCAKIYNKKLKNKNLLFVFGNPKKPMCIETSFYSHNFLHLTGVECQIKSTDFFKRTLKGQLNISQFELNNTSELKLRILHNLMNIERTARIVGDFSDNKVFLTTDKLVGNIKCCLGFVKDKNLNNYFVPNTALNTDIRDISKKQARLLLVMKKNTNDKFYSEITHLAKEISFDDISLDISILQKIKI